MHRLDSRAPFVLDTRELGRRAGAMRELTFTAPAPSNLGLAVIGVPEASPIELNVRLEAVVDGVLVSGTASVELAGECVRCLESVTSAMDVTFQELYVYPEDHASGHRRGEQSAEDEQDETVRLEGDLLDLEPVLRVQWCSLCRSSRSVGRTVRACAWSVGRCSLTTRNTTMRPPTPGGPH